jgi:polysaccharide export outer membrane protein
MKCGQEYGVRAAVAAALLLIGLVLLGGCASETGPPAAPASEVYRVGPPDQLGITILPDPIIEREVVVRPDGMISIDLVGDVPASGRTAEEIASDIETRISRFKRNATVTVALVQSLSTQITVLGEVFQPSTFPISRDTRIVEAIGRVGGPRFFAAKSRIRVIRPQADKAQVYKVSLSAMENGDLRTNMMLQGGDLVYVPPTVMASIGYKIRAFFFPFQQVFAFGAKTALTVFTGGAGAGL